MTGKKSKRDVRLMFPIYVAGCHYSSWCCRGREEDVLDGGMTTLLRVQSSPDQRPLQKDQLEQDETAILCSQTIWSLFGVTEMNTSITADETVEATANQDGTTTAGENTKTTLKFLCLCEEPRTGSRMGVIR